MPSFNPSQLPRLDGKIALVTGGSSGLGLYTCLELAKHGARVYLGARSRSAANKALEVIRAEVPNADIRLLDLELSDLANVKAAAQSFLQQENKLHILVNNGGVMAPPRAETKQGFEIQFGVNYISHFYLTKLLLPTLLATAAATKPGDVRVVNVSSFGHSMVPKEGIVFDDIPLKASNGSLWQLYGQSKLANLLHAKEIARRYGTGDHPIFGIPIHPGMVKTNLVSSPKESTWWFRMAQPFLQIRAFSARDGANPQLYAAASPEVKISDNGSYYGPGPKKETPSALAQDAALAKKLWDWTEVQLVEKGFS